jgi:hypothetical protein
MNPQGLAKRGTQGEGGHMAECVCECDRCRRSGVAIQTAVRYRTRVATLAHAIEAGDLPKALELWAILRGEAVTEAAEAGQEGEE